jgi:uncharacterized protein DUF6788
MSADQIRRRVREKLREQRALVEELLREREQLSGSLFERWAVCGKEGCACREGRRHGPYYVLSTRSGGRGGFAYLPGSRASEARDLVQRHRAFRAGMRRLKRVGEQLVTLLRRYQEVLARQGGRRVGISTHATS